MNETTGHDCPGEPCVICHRLRLVKHHADAADAAEQRAKRHRELIAKILEESEQSGLAVQP